MKNPHSVSFDGKHISLFGYGIEGSSVLSYLSRFAVASIAIYDERDHEQVHESISSIYPHLPITVHHGLFPRSVQSDVLFRSPSIRPDIPVFQDASLRGALVTSATNVFFAQCKAPIIGVTGTKGKGTTSAWITEMLKQEGKKVYLGGNIGTSPLDFIDSVTPDDWVVLELSSFQLWDCDASPAISVIVMVTSDHLDIHQDISEYKHAKSNICNYQTSNDSCVINWEHENSRTYMNYGNGMVFKTSSRYRCHPGAYAWNGNIYIHDGLQEEFIARVEEISLPGLHTIQNALSASMAAKLAGCSSKSIRSALQSFQGLPHRLEFVREVEGIRFYDDSFSTTPETTIAAIQSFPESKILILGGSSKGSDFHELGQIIDSSSTIKAIIGIGEEWNKIKKYIHTSLPVIIEGCTDMNQIFSAVMNLAKHGDVVLLSPGCASFGMFKNYKERGDLFKKEVHSLP